MKKIFLLFNLFFLVFGFFPFLINAQGIVPCGPGTGEPCNFCHIFVLFKNLVDFFLFDIIPPLAVLVATIGGIFFFFSAGDPAKVTKGKTILTSLVIGLFVIYASWILIGLFFSLIGVADWTGLRDGWYEINCP